MNLIEAKQRWAEAATDQALRGSPAWELQYGAGREAHPKGEQCPEPTNQQLDPTGLLGLYP